MQENRNIDELFSSLIDEELTKRQATEAKRLVSNDPKLAEKLRRMKRCRLLLSSMPFAEAPPGIPEEVMASLERRALLGRQNESVRERRGARGLMVRRVIAAAAMIALVGVLGAVIYTIVAGGEVSQPVTGGTASVDEPTVTTTGVETVDESDTAEAVAGASWAAVQLNAELQLTTDSVDAVTVKVGRILGEHLPAGIDYDIQGVENTYAVSCNDRIFAAILADLQTVWHEFNEASFTVEMPGDVEELTVTHVTTGQIARIVTQDSFEDSVRVAKDFAVLNAFREQMPGREFASATELQVNPLPLPPKPKLTSDERRAKKVWHEEQEGGQVNLTIVINGLGR